MNPDVYLQFSDTNQWGVIAPEISLAVFALLLLVLELVLPKRRLGLIGPIALAGQLALLVSMFVAFCLGCLPAGSWFSGMITLTSHGDVYRIFFLASSCFVTWLGIIYLRNQPVPKVEFFAIVLVATAALMLLGVSSHFVMLFVALETVTVAFYILVSYCRHNVLSLEAGLKYLVLGALSSAILLFGIVLLYGVAGNPALPGSSADSMAFTDLAAFIATNPDNFVVLAGAGLVLAGIMFKLGAFPFQIWVPDVYQGAPIPVTAMLAVASKAAGVFLLVNLVTGPFGNLQAWLVHLLSVAAIVTILFGNITALTQRNVKRLMGLSGIAHAGYLLVGVVALIQGASLAWIAIMFYLFAYQFASFGAFGVMTLLGRDCEQELEDYEDLAKSQPFLAAVLAISVGSLAGIPPLAGFIGKLLLFIAAFQAGLWSLLAVAVVGVVISIYYYFSWIREVYFHGTDLLAEDRLREDPWQAGIHVSRFSSGVLAVLAVLTVVLGVYQGLLGGLLRF